VGNRGRKKQGSVSREQGAKKEVGGWQLAGRSEER